MIHLARPTTSPIVNFVFAWNLFSFAHVLLDFEKCGRTDNTSKNSDHYRPGLWLAELIIIVFEKCSLRSYKDKISHPILNKNNL